MSYIKNVDSAVVAIVSSWCAENVATNAKRIRAGQGQHNIRMTKARQARLKRVSNCWAMAKYGTKKVPKAGAQ